jgi:hypothetical protein
MDASNHFQFKTVQCCCSSTTLAYAAYKARLQSQADTSAISSELGSRHSARMYGMMHVRRKQTPELISLHSEPPTLGACLGQSCAARLTILPDNIKATLG